MALEDCREIVFGITSPNTRITLVMTIVEAIAAFRPSQKEKRYVAKAEDIITEILVPTRVVPKKFPSSLKKSFNIMALLSFDSTKCRRRILFNEVNAASEPARRRLEIETVV